MSDTLRIVEVDTTRPLSKGSSMLTIRSTEAAVSAEQLREKIKRDRAYLQGLKADYFDASGRGTFPTANDVANAIEDAIGDLDNLEVEVGHAINSYDARSTASVY